MSRGERSLRDIALGLLARREHSRLELERKLTARGHGSAKVHELLDVLESDGSLCNRRFADSYVHSRSNRGDGPIKIRHQLQARGLDASVIEAAIDTCSHDWHALAVAAREKRFGSALPSSFSERARQTRFLTQRGFSNEQIRAALNRSYADE